MKKNLILLLLTFIPAALLFSINFYFHKVAHNATNDFFEIAKKNTPSFSSNLTKNKGSVFGSTTTEILSTDHKIIVTSKASLNPLNNYIEIDYLPLKDDRSPLKVKLFIKFLDLETSELSFVSDVLKFTGPKQETTFEDVSLKIQMPILTLLKSKDMSKEILKQSGFFQTQRFKIQNLEDKKPLVRADGLNLNYQFAEITPNLVDIKFGFGFKKIIFFKDEAASNQLLDEAQLQLSLGTLKVSELHRLAEMFPLHDGKDILPSLMILPQFFEKFAASFDYKGLINQKPVRASGNIEIPSNTNLALVMKKLKAELNIYIPANMIFQLSKNMVINNIKETFFKLYTIDEFTLNDPKKIDQINKIIEKKIPEDLLRKVAMLFHGNGISKPSPEGLHFNLSFENEVQKLHGAPRNIMGMKIEIEFFINSYLKNTLDEYLSELKLDLSQGGFEFTKKDLETSDFFKNIKAEEIAQPIIPKPAPAFMPNRTQRPINHKLASSLEKVQKDQYFQNYRDKKYHDCWVNENISGYTQIFVKSQFRGNYTDEQADSLLGVLASNVNNGNCKLKQ